MHQPSTASLLILLAFLFLVSVPRRQLVPLPPSLYNPDIVPPFLSGVNGYFSRSECLPRTSLPHPDLLSGISKGQ